VIARVLLLVGFVGAIGATAPAFTLSAEIPSGVHRCAVRTAHAPSIAVLLGRARASLGRADAVLAVRVGAPPRWYWGRSYPLSPRAITRHSPWVYVTVPRDRPAIPIANVAAQRGSWQAGLLLQSLHASICAAGQQPEAGYTLVTPDGTRATTASSGGALQRFPRSYTWPFAHVDAGFTDRLVRLARRYSFHVVSLIVLHGIGDAPQIRIESDHPAALLRNLPAISSALYPATADCWATTPCFNGTWLEAVDRDGRPFLATGGQRAIGTGVGSDGSLWIRPGLSSPYPTIDMAPPVTTAKRP
jgi:hypothetical protein